MAFWRSSKLAPDDTSADTGQHQSAQVSTGLTPVGAGSHQDHHQSAQGGTDEDDDALIHPLGAMRAPKEHAVELLQMLRNTGLEGRTVLACELKDCHHLLCERLGWMPKRWAGVGREFNKLPGVRKGKVWIGYTRMTAYTIEPLTDAVVELAEEKRKRA